MKVSLFKYKVKKDYEVLFVLFQRIWYHTTARQIRKNGCMTKYRTYSPFWTKILCAPARFAIASMEKETLKQGHRRRIDYPKNNAEAAGDYMDKEHSNLVYPQGL